MRHSALFFSFLFIIPFINLRISYGNETDKREYERSCRHWLEDSEKIELLLTQGQPIKLFSDTFEKKIKTANLILNEVHEKKKYYFQLDNGLNCIFSEYTLNEIKEPRLALIMYDISKLLRFGNVPPIVWRDNFVVNGKKLRGTVQLFFDKLDMKGYDDDNITRSWSGISQKELDIYRIFNLLMGTWEASLESATICGEMFLVHDDYHSMEIKQYLEKYGEIPFVSLHEFVEDQIHNYIKSQDENIKRQQVTYEKAKKQEKGERQIRRKQLQLQKLEEEKKLQIAKNIFNQQKENFRKQQVLMQQPIYYDHFANVPEPTNPQIDYLQQQLQMLDEMDRQADINYIESFPFNTSLPLNDYERHRIGCYFAYNPPKFEHNYVIWNKSYWLQFTDEKTKHDIKYVLYPKFLTTEIKQQLQKLTKVRLLEIFLKRRYYRLKGDQITEYTKKCESYVDDIIDRKYIILEEFERREKEANTESKNE